MLLIEFFAVSCFVFMFRLSTDLVAASSLAASELAIPASGTNSKTVWSRSASPASASQTASPWQHSAHVDAVAAALPLGPQASA